MLFEYILILIIILISIIISSVLFLLSFVLVFQKPDSEKLSAYECGFQPFEDTRLKFDVRYYLISILFLIFDLEIMFLFPWSVILLESGLFIYWIMCFFIIILFIGFFYEWNKGALSWE